MKPILSIAQGAVQGFHFGSTEKPGSAEYARLSRVVAMLPGEGPFSS